MLYAILSTKSMNFKKEHERYQFSFDEMTTEKLVNHLFFAMNPDPEMNTKKVVIRLVAFFHLRLHFHFIWNWILEICVEAA